MARRVRTEEWKYDNKLKSDLEMYVLQKLQRNEILNFVNRDYSSYMWSMRTLDRRLRYFQIHYVDKTVCLDDAKDVLKKELDGPGALLGYRAMAQKLRVKYEIKLPRDLVYDMMYDLDPEGLTNRPPGVKKKKKGHFTTKGTNWVHSLDGHDKLMGYQNSTFPLAIYGCIDTASRKLLWIRI